jgi:hypothetical protein
MWYPIYLYEGKKYRNNVDDSFYEQHELDIWFRKKVKYYLNLGVSQQWRARKHTKIKRMYNKTTNPHYKMIFTWILKRQEQRIFHNKQLAHRITFIKYFDISYIIEETHGDIETFIKKNNYHIVMGEVVCMNLTDDDVKLIKARWMKTLDKNKKNPVIDDSIGVSPIELMLELLKNKGNLSECARRLKVSRKALSEMLHKNKTLNIIYTEINDMVLDYVEWQLMRLVDSGERAAIQYFLNAKGQERGFGSYEARRRNNKIVSGVGLRDEEFNLD